MLSMRLKGAKIAAGGTAPSWRSSTSAAPGVSLNLTLSVPPGVVNGDILFAFIRSGRGSGTTVTPPSGWTQQVFSNTDPVVYAFSRVASSEPASYTWTRSGNNGNFEGVMAAISGASSVFTVGATSFASPSATGTATSISLTSPPALVLAAYHVNFSPTISSGPSGMTVGNTTTFSDGIGGATGVYYVTETGSTSGNKTLTLSTTTNIVSYLIGLYGA